MSSLAKATAVCIQAVTIACETMASGYVVCGAVWAGGVGVEVWEVVGEGRAEAATLE